MGGSLSDMMVKPHQSPLFDDPKDYGLQYDNVVFKANDGVTLKGWLIKGGKDKVIIQTHFGVQCNRAGYDPKGKGMVTLTKKPVCFLRQAKYLHDKGFTVLMYDMRNHGESALGTVPWVSWGKEEAKDVMAAVDFIQTHPDYSSARIGLLSICMGLSASTFAFGLQDGLATRKNIACMIGVQPLTYSAFVDAFGMPGFLANCSSKTSEKRLDFDLKKETFMPYAKDVSVPTCIIQNTNDPWTKKELVEEYYNSLRCPKEMMWVDLEKNRAAAYDFLGSEPAKALAFFDKHM